MFPALKYSSFGWLEVAFRLHTSKCAVDATKILKRNSFVHRIMKKCSNALHDGISQLEPAQVALYCDKTYVEPRVINTQMYHAVNRNIYFYTITLPLNKLDA